MSPGWKETVEMVRLGAFERIAKLSPSRDLYMSFLVKGCSLVKSIPNKFPAALAIAYKWLDENDERIPLVLFEEYRTFFGAYKGHRA